MTETILRQYDEFVKSKVVVSKDAGFGIDLSEINPILKDHQKLIVQWMVLGAMVISLNSCGLPGAIIRTAGNLVQSAGGLVGM